MGLRVDNISVELGKNPVLADIDITFEKGRICAVLGPNGAGKTTLLKAIAGLVPVRSGDISLDDDSLSNLTSLNRAKTLAYLPQNYKVAWDILVRDVVALGRFAHRGSANDNAEAIEQAMQITDTARFAERTTGQLSGGELARVMLARVLAGEPDWILADEPLASLDPAYQIDMVARFREVANAGTAIIVVLHDINLAAKLADDVLMLKEGRVLAAGSASEELSAENLSKLYDIDIADIGEDSLFRIG